MDPRFRFLDYLTELRTKIGEVSVDLQKRAGADAEAAAGQWSRWFEGRRTALDGDINASTSAKPRVTAALGSVAFLIVSAVLGEVGKAAWQMISPFGK